MKYYFIYEYSTSFLSSNRTIMYYIDLLLNTHRLISNTTCVTQAINLIIKLNCYYVRQCCKQANQIGEVRIQKKSNIPLSNKKKL